MPKKRCQFCGSSIDKEWRFCPQCGRPTSVQGIDVSGINIDITKVVQEVIPKVIRGLMEGSIFNNVNKSNDIKHERPRHAQSNVKEVIEPEDLVSKHGDTVIHAINLPGVKDRSNIDINKMENSIEVRAYDGERLYLKIIRRDKEQALISEEFANENLVLVLKKIN